MSADSRTPKRRWFCTHQSERLDKGEERVRVRQALANGVEPEPEYRTGKMWND